MAAGSRETMYRNGDAGGGDPCGIKVTEDQGIAVGKELNEAEGVEKQGADNGLEDCGTVRVATDLGRAGGMRKPVGVVGRMAPCEAEGVRSQG